MTPQEEFDIWLSRVLKLIPMEERLNIAHTSLHDHPDLIKIFEFMEEKILNVISEVHTIPNFSYFSERQTFYRTRIFLN